MGVVNDLHRAREAYERREWVSAYRALRGGGGVAQAWPYAKIRAHIGLQPQPNYQVTRTNAAA